ncbi:Beta-galactosidase trimerization domain protein [Caballeronia calidae]|uniref:Beta-galactosidase trimerization domain protein n=1 Tax=Caballeronia calidae TaxID=1777139 RepID=A0A158DZY4_9BURK|nr:Beta-galactosidase trimerization domain protein [Caballeronia calidae]
MDLVGYDSEKVVDYLMSVDANCLVINAGGIIDLFPNPLELSNPSRFLGGQDILRELCDACRAKGIRVIARVDFRGVERRVFEQRPDVFSVDANGFPRISRYLGEPLPETLYTPCYLSWYRNEHAFEFARHLIREYGVDGIWENASVHEGICYCKRCEAAYKSEVGEGLPRGGVFAEAGYDGYRAWKARKLQEHLENFRREIKAFGDDKAFCAEIFGLFYDLYDFAGHDLYNIKEAMDFLVTPLFVANDEPLSAPTILTKFLKALDADKTPVVLFGHLGTDNQLRYVSNSPSELKIWMWQAIGSGASLWDVIFNGQHAAATYDRRNEALVAEVFRTMKKFEHQLHNRRPVAPVGIFFSQKTNLKRRRPNRDEDHYLTNILGLDQVLTDSHIQYDFVLDLNLSAEAIRGKELLILPNAEFISDAEADIIREFVRNGGKVIATGATSLGDESGARRENFALSDVLGCDYAGTSVDASKWGYQRIKESAHRVFSGMEKTELAANWGQSVLVRERSHDGSKALATFVPPIYPQPPEKSWLTSMDTPYATILENQFGNGRAVYFATEIDRNIWHHGHLDFSTLLGNAVSYMLSDEHVLETNAPPSVQMTLTEVTGEAPGGFILHMVNLTSTPRRPVANIIPVRDFSVTLKLPAKEFVSCDALIGNKEDVNVSAHEVTSDGDLCVRLSIGQIDDVLSLHLVTQ